MERARAHTDVPVALGFGIATPEHAAQAAAAGADGVIVGSRLVRAAAEGEDIRAVVESLAGALRYGARTMGFILTALTGFVVWIVLWSLDWKAFDAFLITILIVLIGATARIITPFLPGSRDA